MPLGSGINPGGFQLGQLNFERLYQLAETVDPAPVAQALASMLGAGGAMDMTGSASNPTGAMPSSGMDYASIFGMAPEGGAGMSPLPAGMMQAMMQPQSRAQFAPGASPQPSAKSVQLPSTQVPRGQQPVPTLGQILGGGR